MGNSHTFMQVSTCGFFDTRKSAVDSMGH